MKQKVFDQIVSSMNEGLILLDEHGIVLNVNNSAKSVFSLRDDIVGTSFLNVEGTQDLVYAIGVALKGHHSEFVIQRNGNEYQINIRPIESEEKTYSVLILAFDISDRAFAERNRQEFTANVTHELKTPLQSIIGIAELLETGLAKPEDRAKFIGNIRKEAIRLMDLINDIIRLSQLDENVESETENVVLLDVAKEVMEVLSASATKKKVSMKLDAEDLTIKGVRRYIYEIFYNLCDNAIRYNVEGGNVLIRIYRVNTHTILSVSDTGIGIAPEHRARIFERFYRVDKSHSRETGGTGLGLSIVKHATQFHGGKLEMESEINKGTTIKVII